MRFINWFILQIPTENHPRDTFFGEWPNMCAVQKTISLGVLKKSIYISGGSLIAPNVILTAAHYVS